MGSANIHIYIPSRGSFSWTRGRFGGFMKKTKGFRRKPADSWENDRCDVAGVGHGHHHHPWPLWWHHFAASWRSGSRLGKAKNTRVYWVKKKLCRLAVWVCRSQLESIDGPKNEIFEQNLNRIWTEWWPIFWPVYTMCRLEYELSSAASLVGVLWWPIQSPCLSYFRLENCYWECRIFPIGPNPFIATLKSISEKVQFTT